MVFGWELVEEAEADAAAAAEAAVFDSVWVNNVLQD